jgi:hypothetical protein
MSDPLGVPDDLRPLHAACERFRAALTRCDPLTLPVTLQDFPAGACGDAALLLGRYLKDTGFGATDYLLGWRVTGDRRASHAWLQQGDLVIDITADQFPEIDRPVIVERGSAWHAQLEGETEHEGDYRVYDETTVAVLDIAYRRVLALMRAS